MEMLEEMIHNQIVNFNDKIAILKNIADRDIHRIDLKGDTQLHLVLKNVQVNEGVIKHLLDVGAPVNAINHSGQSPLHYALKYKNCDFSIVRLLVDRGADVQLGDNIGKNPLFYAVEKKHCPLDVIEYLIGNGASIHILNGEGFPVLHYALFQGHTSLDTIKLLLKKGSDVHTINIVGEAALNVAVRYKRKDVVKLFLEIPKIKLNLADKAGYTPLHRACTTSYLFAREIDSQHLTIFPLESDPGIVRLLLEAGANVEKKTKKFELSPLYLAANQCNPRIIKMLLDYGARVNALCRNNFSPLHFACIKGKSRFAIKCLLDAGALVFSHPMQKMYPKTDCQLDKNSPFHRYVVLYNQQKNEDNLQKVQLLLKYALLEKPFSKIFSEELHDQTQEMLQLLEKQYLRELHSVCVKPNITLAQFILRMRLQNDEDCHIEEIIEVLKPNVYPIYKEVLLGLLTRKELKNGFERHMVYTVKNSPKQNNNPKYVCLNNDSLRELQKYLSNEGLMSLLLAFHESNKNIPSLIDFSTPSKTLLDEIELEAERFSKRARIN